ncbi:hypothetical protein [Rathayibacter sp. VKM Ac-2927]|nr:hypothetical protein [Rathayibacter sp. VKM Ac-2927]MCJ1688282.1 hypothetical protein [Rathayibacter sp. VKM Ac-2927]
MSTTIASIGGLGLDTALRAYSTNMVPNAEDKGKPGTPHALLPPSILVE